MLVDSHCHLDFPDFASELDAVVARARRRRHRPHGHHLHARAPLRRSAGDRRAFPDIYCSVGTHPHNATRNWTSTRRRADRAYAASQSRGDRRSGSRLSLRQQPARCAGARLSQTYRRGARDRLPLVIHSREADADMARILEEETGQGAFPAVLHCFTGGRELALRAPWRSGIYVSFTGILTFKTRSDLRDDRRRAAGGSHSGGNRRAISRAHAVSRQAQRAGLRGGDREGLGRDARRLRRRDRAADHGEFLPPVQQSAAPTGAVRAKEPSTSAA